jgi:hypothetical protein
MISTIFCDGPIKLVHCKKIKIGLVKHPQLINVKQNKNLQFYKRGSHNMVIKKVSITMRGGSEKKGQKKGGGV